MRRWLAILTLLIAVGCSREQPVSGKIVIKGSNTFGEELGPRLIEAFRSGHDAVEFYLESKGSGSGFAALLAGECDIAASSRPINEDEQRQAKSRGIKIEDYIVGSYGVAVIVNNGNPVTGLKHGEVRDIFTGVLTNWKQAGGPDLPIHIYIRDPVAGTYLGFQELAMERRPYAATAKQLKSYPEIVAAIQNDKGGIGYAGMNFLDKPGIKAFHINGILPSITSVNEGDYPYSRTLHLYTNKAKGSDAARAFIRFAQSSAGQKVVSAAGFVRRFEPRWWSGNGD